MALWGLKDCGEKNSPHHHHHPLVVSEWKDSLENKGGPKTQSIMDVTQRSSKKINQKSPSRSKSALKTNKKTPKSQLMVLTLEKTKPNEQINATLLYRVSTDCSQVRMTSTGATKQPLRNCEGE